MKKLFFALLLFPLVLSCVQQMEEVESTKIAGIWAVVDEDDMTSRYFVFKTGEMSEYKSEKSFYVHDGFIWGAAPSSFDIVNIYKYSLQDGVLHYTYHDKDISSDLEMEGGVLMIGDYRCLPAGEVRSSYYSEIVLSETNRTVFLSGDHVEWSYEIENPANDHGLVVKEAPEWCGGVSGVTVSDGRISFSVRTAYEDLKGKFVFSYISAQDVEVEVEHKATRLILDEASCVMKSSAASGSFGFTIVNDPEGMQLDVVTDVDWITVTDHDGNTITYSVTENNSGSPRSGKITLSYMGIRADYEVSQIFSRAYETWLGDWTFTGANGIVRNVTFLPGVPDATFLMIGYEGLPDEVAITVNWDEAGKKWEILNQKIAESFVSDGRRKGELWLLGADFSQLFSIYEPGILICTCEVSEDGTFVATSYRGEIQYKYYWWYYQVIHMRLALKEADGGWIHITDINGKYPKFPFTITRPDLETGI